MNIQSNLHRVASQPLTKLANPGMEESRIFGSTYGGRRRSR